MTDWLAAVRSRAPDIAAAYDALDGGRAAVHREVAGRAGLGTAPELGRQLDALADVLVATLATLPPGAFGLPGGESDWTVAQAIGHDIDARHQLTLAGALAARGRWPSTAGPVVQGVAGPADATREELLARMERSRRTIDRAVHAVVGHETDPCPLEHPQVGRLTCGGWLLFAGVHDCMHLDQLDHLDRLARIGTR